MTEDQAIALVEGRRPELEIPAEMALEGAEKAIVSYTPDPERPGPIEDRVAWIVSYVAPWQTMEVIVDDQTGRILRVRTTP